MSATRTARERARTELTREIKDVARGQLATDGADRLSLRAVARELEMVPSALYRYFPSRDHLLTALIVEAYDALGDQVEQAVTAVPSADLFGRWSAACHALRTWALQRPHEFALLYGSPVPGYRAPEDTIAPASRVYRPLLDVVRDAQARGELAVPSFGPPLPPALAGDTDRLQAALRMTEISGDALVKTITAWTQLVGGVSLEVFGHLKGAFPDDAAFFAHSTHLMADMVGLRASTSG